MQQQEPNNWHSMEGDAVLAQLETGLAGLSSPEAVRRLQSQGRNLLIRNSGDNSWLIFRRQFNNPIGWLLIIAGVVSLLLRKHTDAFVVFAAVVINSLLGFIQEFKAGRTLASLAAMLPDSAVVLRDGRQQTVPAEELVTGDIVMLQSGDKVPADLRLLATKSLLIQESVLTGEALPTAKDRSATAADTGIGDRTDMAYSGTSVLQGTGTGVVVATGEQTELGRINTLLHSTGQLQTPLTKQLQKVSNGITVAVVLVVTLLVGFGIMVKDAPLNEALMLAVSLAVAAIPEGLPAVITIALAFGVQRMAARRAVVRHLPAVETLGSTTVICSDKTGTLTRNEMTVQVAWAEGREYRFAGLGYAPVGDIEHDGIRISDLPDKLRELLNAAALCSNASLRRVEDEWIISGDPTEAALLTAAAKAGISAQQLRSSHPRLDVIPFESGSQFMATLNEFSGVQKVLLKGAVEKILQLCLLTPAEKERITAVMETYARQGLRVIAAASMVSSGNEATLPGEFSGGFTFAGLIGMMDPPRSEAVDAVRICHKAGITVKMITGDHPVTAEAIGRELGLMQSGQKALQGLQLEMMNDDELKAAVSRTNVMARVSPEQKLRVVKALQDMGHVVAMTGDGVNDAPALKRADIGVAMGITGTDVSREAAKVVLLDDNFASIAAAVEEGRRVYDNLIKSIAFILPVNLGLACTLSGAMFFFPTVPLSGVNELLLAMSPSQTLWINLVASVTLSIPLAFEVLEPGAMQRRPRPPGEPVFSRFLILRLVLVALLMAVGSCALFLWEYYRSIGSGPLTHAVHHLALAKAQTICVTCITFTQVFYLLNCRSLRNSIISQGIFTNPAIFIGIAVLLLLQACFIYLPPLQLLFGSTSLDFKGWLDAMLIGALVLPMISAEKWLRNMAANKTDTL